MAGCYQVQSGPGTNGIEVGFGLAQVAGFNGRLGADQGHLGQVHDRNIEKIGVEAGEEDSLGRSIGIGSDVPGSALVVGVGHGDAVKGRADAGSEAEGVRLCKG